MNVKTVNLFQKGIWEISSIEGGHRTYRMIHRASEMEGKGRTRQEAYDDLMEQLDVR